MDSVQDEINTLLMDEGESAFIEGVTFGVRLMMEVGGGINKSSSMGSVIPCTFTHFL